MMGITELRPMAKGLYGFHVTRRSLFPRLKKVEGLFYGGRANGLFFVKMGPNEPDTVEAAREKFLKLVSAAGLGEYFGAGGDI